MCHSPQSHGSTPGLSKPCPFGVYGDFSTCTQIKSLAIGSQSNLQCLSAPRRLRGETESSHSPLQGCFPWQPAPIHTWPRGHSKIASLPKDKSLSHHLGSSQAFWSSVPETRWRPIYIFLNTNHNITGTLADHKLPPEEAEWGAFWSRAYFLCSSADSHLIHPLISAWPLRSLSERKLWKQIFPGPQVQGTWPLCFLLKPTSLLQGFYLTEENYLTEVLSSFFESLLWSYFSFVSSGRHGFSHGLCREWACQSRFSKFAFLVAFPCHLPVIYRGDALEVISFRICYPSNGNVSLKWSDCRCLDSGWTGGIYVILVWNHIWLLKKFIYF